MSLPSDSDYTSDGETIYSDSEISSDESIHESDIDFIDDSDLETSDESSDENLNDKCTIFKSTVIIR